AVLLQRRLELALERLPVTGALLLSGRQRFDGVVELQFGAGGDLIRACALGTDLHARRTRRLGVCADRALLSTTGDQERGRQQDRAPHLHLSHPPHSTSSGSSANGSADDGVVDCGSLLLGV